MTFDLDGFRCRASDFDLHWELLDYDGEGSGRLSDREIEFLDSLSRWNGYYTPGQVKWLRSIYDRIFK